jgi:hypothetical protein
MNQSRPEDVLIDALRGCAAQFRDYAGHHKAKGDAVKELNNMLLAENAEGCADRYIEQRKYGTKRPEWVTLEEFDLLEAYRAKKLSKTLKGTEWEEFMQKQPRIKVITEAAEAAKTPQFHCHNTADKPEFKPYPQAAEGQLSGGFGITFKKWCMKETDPTGKAPSDPGAKLDAGKVRAGLLAGFGNALMAVAKVATYGAKKYSDGGWQHVPQAEERYTDAFWRHLLEQCNGPIDEESSLEHEAQVVWNGLAALELRIRRERDNAQ